MSNKKSLGFKELVAIAVGGMVGFLAPFAIVF